MSKFKKGAVSIVLAVSILITFVCSFGGVTATASSSLNSQGLASNVQDGVILHAWNWSYNTIKNNMANIAAAGYSTVQTSPVQKPKDYGATWTQVSTQWWKLYQPTTLEFADGGTWLGTKDEFESMCDTAHSYGIKVIVDIVANHMASAGGGGNNASNRNTQIPSAIRNNDNYWHVNNITANDGSRYDMTHGYIGMPDLNTGNTDIQNYIINLLKTCIDLGADGFRFDAAKHIEVPEDSSGASNFWPNVTSAAKNYASQKGKSLYMYAEILNTASTALTNYTKYMSITDNQTGNNVLNNVINSNASSAASPGYVFNVGASKSVLWAESHDTYASDQTTLNVTDQNIRLAWAIVASRAGATSLFLARPASFTGGVMGQSGNTTWRSSTVVEVNKFHNKFIGQSEYLSSSGSVVINERGTSGAVLVNLSSSSVNVNATANRMASGTYTNHISSGSSTFTVSNGKITGTIPAKSVAVIYNTGSEPTDPPTEPTDPPSGSKTLYFQDKLNWSSVKAYMWKDSSGHNNADWPGVNMAYVETTPNSNEKIYSITFNPDEFDRIIFTNGSGTQTVDIVMGTSGTCYYCTTASGGKYNVSSYQYT